MERVPSLIRRIFRGFLGGYLSIHGLVLNSRAETFELGEFLIEKFQNHPASLIVDCSGKHLPISRDVRFRDKSHKLAHLEHPATNFS